MDAGTLSSLAVSGVALVVGLLTYRNNRAGQNATARIEDKKVELNGKQFDLQALGQTVQTLQAEVARLDGDLGEEREARRAAESRADEEREARKRAEQSAEDAKREATRAMRKLTRRVAQLEQVLREHDMPVPPALADVDL